MTRPSTRKHRIIGFIYAAAQAIVQVLKQCGNDLTLDNVTRQAENLKDFATDTTLPGIAVNTSPQDYAPMKQLQMIRFSGKRSDLMPLRQVEPA
jgi:branched-chain amino acid transport system substrate-binding protein